MLGAGFPPLPGDPGGGPSNRIDGTYAGATLPSYMDPNGDHGKLIILKLEPAVGKKLPDHPFTLRTSIERRVGGKIEGAFSEAQGQAYALKVRSQHQMERLLSMTELTDGTAIKISKHPGLNSTRCVISCRELAKIEDDDILENLESQNVSGIRRITRRVGDGKENTATVILTINGTTMPEHIDIGYRRYRTRPYYPAPMLCYQCYKFGHTRTRCQQQNTTCGNCGQQHEVAKDVPCSNQTFCSRCQTKDHAIGSRKCPVYQTEDAIQHIRVNQGIQYPAARRIYEAMQGEKTYAGTTVHSKDQTIHELSTKFEIMVKKMEEKDAKIQALENQIAVGPTTTTNSDLNHLRNLVENLQKELKNKDERIQALESSSNKDSRMDLVRKHGTIEDLIARVSALEAKVSKKDKEIDVLKSVNQAYKQALDGKPTLKSQRKEANPMQPVLTDSCTPNHKASRIATAINTDPAQETSMTIEKQNNAHPEHTGAKKKSRKTVTKQNSGEMVPKRTKADELTHQTQAENLHKNDKDEMDNIMYISDSDEVKVQEQAPLDFQSVISDLDFSSDENMQNDQDVSMSR
ncbi:uncharacterized protein LOC135703674 [Ochlerotatus camptorhynchus]|uniref:uncharacterized protein LOC135703674 n=1 Tax=Ochlerotatus camptorhynchus TaxID=644619 RepID=UPI0031D060EF